MKSDVLLYEKIYGILKNKIECGLLPPGSKLPSRADLCVEFDTSERSVRRAVEMLAQDGLLETAPKKRPVVASDPAPRQQVIQQMMQDADAETADDILKTGVLLCYPINRRGMRLCTGEDWKIPETIVGNMDPGAPTEFWRLSNRLWHFFISRVGNELILRTVDSLGLGEVDPLPGALQIRADYLAGLKELIKTVKCGGSPESVHFDALFPLYNSVLDRREGTAACRVRAGSPLLVGTEGLERRLRKAQERYSSVYMDLLGLIATGRYSPGDRLPSHGDLQRQYGVSLDTAAKAVRVLQEWGVVKAVRGQGIFAAMDLDGLLRAHIDPVLIARHVRRYLDSLELLSLTIEGVAAHAAAHASREEGRSLCEAMGAMRETPREQQMIPAMLLQFITGHIRYDALRRIYEILQENHGVGRSIPELVCRDQTPANGKTYQRCVDAAALLAEGDAPGFARQAAGVFQTIHRLVAAECKRLGYWEPAMQVYDGDALWQ